MIRSCMVLLLCLILTKISSGEESARKIVVQSSGKSKSADLQKQTENAAAAFAYPGAKRIDSSNIGTIALFNEVTDDGLAKVDAWYREKLSIDPDDRGGVSSLEDRLQSLFEDGARPKTARNNTSITIVHRTAEFTLVVTLNRLEADKQTLISRTYIPEKDDRWGIESNADQLKRRPDTFPFWKTGKSIEQYAAAAGLKPTESLDLGKGVKLDLVLIPAGTFVMGAGAGEERHRGSTIDTTWEKPAHTVTIARPFYMGKYEVTQAQWLAVMGKAPGSRGTLEAEKDPKKFGNYPVEDIDLQETLDFCEKASQRTKHAIRLPSEAEWEYACRGGTTTYYFFGNSMQRDLGKDGIEDVLSYYMKGNVAKPYEVGKHKPNPWGLYDIIGNVAERCADTTKARNYVGAPTDGSPWMAKGKPETNVIRGTWDPRSAARTAFQSVNFHSDTLGMRVVMEVSPRRKMP